LSRIDKHWYPQVTMPRGVKIRTCLLQYGFKLTTQMIEVWLDYH